MKVSIQGRIIALATTLAVTPVLAAACSSKADEESGAGKDGVAMGPGVTETSISLGELTDLSGPFGGANRQILAGNRLYWDAVNADGGVCGREVELDVQDHKFDPQTAVTLYRSMRDAVLGLQVSNGSPTTAAIMDMLEDDHKFTVASVYSSQLLGRDALVVPGTTYDLETINGIDYLMRERGVQRGDVLGMAHIPGEYGESVLAGARTAADAMGLELAVQEIASDTTDMSAVLANLRAKDIHHVVLGATGAQVVSLASLAKSAGYELTILVTNVLAPDALKGPARAALEQEVVLTSNSGPFDADYPDFVPLREKYVADNPDEAPTYFVNFGFVTAAIYHQVLDRACAAKDLTGEGLIEAARGLGEIEFGSAYTPLDLSAADEPASRSSFVLAPDGSKMGGTRLVEGPFVSDVAAEATPHVR